MVDRFQTGFTQTDRHVGSDPDKRGGGACRPGLCLPANAVKIECMGQAPIGVVSGKDFRNLKAGHECIDIIIIISLFVHDSGASFSRRLFFAASIDARFLS